MAITVYDLLDLSLNDYSRYEVFDITTGETISIDTLDGVKDEYGHYEVMSWDFTKDTFCVNIER